MYTCLRRKDGGEGEVVDRQSFPKALKNWAIRKNDQKKKITIINKRLPCTSARVSIGKKKNYIYEIMTNKCRRATKIPTGVRDTRVVSKRWPPPAPHTTRFLHCFRPLVNMIIIRQYNFFFSLHAVDAIGLLTRPCRRFIKRKAKTKKKNETKKIVRSLK